MIEGINVEVYKDWQSLKDKPIINKNQGFCWMKHLTDDEIKTWENTLKGNHFTAMLNTNILYEMSKIS